MKALFVASIYHKRFLPRTNEFSYSGYYIKFSLDELETLRSRVFGVNRFNLFSFYEKDHGYKDGSSLYKWAQDILEKAGATKFRGQVVLQTFPRVLGYVFNPVSFWYCYEKGELMAVICEVNNTFSESHNYVLLKNLGTQTNYLSKHFHVSPFYPIEGGYFFDFRTTSKVTIDYHIDKQLQLTTSISGKEIEFSDKNLLKLFFKYPLYTFFIVALIHYQALRLFLKKIKFYSKPEKESSEVTYE